MKSDVLKFWDDRAKLSEKAGSNDLIAKSIEIEALAKYFSNELEVMEYGCGNGVTALELARRFNLSIQAYDFSAEMIAEAKLFAESIGLEKRVKFEVGDITRPSELFRRFDIVYTERMVINLPDWRSQLDAIKTLCGYLKPGGKLLLMECSATGLEKINKLREIVGLNKINPPWHNLYLDDDLVAASLIDQCDLIHLDCYSATYYLMSRVVNAWLSAQQGLEPSYDAPVNKLAQLLPSIGDYAQGKIWIFQKRE